METVKTTYYKELLKNFDTFIVATKSIRRGNYYTGNIRDFFLYLEQIKMWDINQVDESIMRDYFGILAARKKQRGTGTLSESTVNCNLSTLRMFSMRMQASGVLKRGMPVPNNFHSPNTNNNLFALKRQVLTTREIKLIYERCQNNLEQSLIALAYGCGLRRTALENIKDTDINFQKGLLTVIQSKNNKTRHVPISDFFLKPLKAYSIERLHILSKQNKSEKRFFIQPSAKTISGDRLNKILKRIIKRTDDQDLKQKKITLHCLRHSIATHLMDAGQSYDYVRNFLGHSLVDTTTIYARNRKVKNYYTI